MQANYDNCPVYPAAGPKVAEELEKIPYNGYENTWEWLARINKLRQELELCRKQHLQNKKINALITLVNTFDIHL